MNTYVPQSHLLTQHCFPTATMTTSLLRCKRFVRKKTGRAHYDFVAEVPYLPTYLRTSILFRGDFPVRKLVAASLQWKPGNRMAKASSPDGQHPLNRLHLHLVRSLQTLIRARRQIHFRASLATTLHIESEEPSNVLRHAGTQIITTI